VSRHGDPLPPSLETYYAELDAGHIKEASSQFSTGVRYALPPLVGAETDARRVIEGRDDLLAWFEERGSKTYVHRLELCVHQGASCLVEGVGVESSTGEIIGTFVASAELDEDGLIDRYLSYRTSPSTETAPAGDGAAPADAADVLHRYFDALDAGAFDEAADQFSEGVVYSHPPYRHTGLDGHERVVFRGRPELRAAFTARGRQSFDHRLLVIGQRGPRCLVEGIVEGLPNGRDGSFISSLTLDGDGRIQRYLSFYCEPAVPRRSP